MGLNLYGCHALWNCGAENRVLEIIIEHKCHTRSSWADFNHGLVVRPQGCQGCQTIQKNVLQINLLSFCATIELKLSKLQKTVKIEKRSSKKPCFLIVFQIFSILGSILAQKTTKSKYLSIVPFICHPGHPWSCESSGVITTLISIFKIFQQQRHLVTFFNFPKMKPKITIIDLRLLERSLYAAIFTIVKIARHYIIFWWKYGKSRSHIWHCDLWQPIHSKGLTKLAILPNYRRSQMLFKGLHFCKKLDIILESGSKIEVTKKWF